MDHKSAILGDEADEISAVWSSAFAIFGVPAQDNPDGVTREVIFDITNLDAPTQPFVVLNEENAATVDHNHVVAGTLLLNGDYTAA